MKAKVYRLYFSLDKVAHDRSILEAAQQLARQFPALTEYAAMGVWEGKGEHCTIFERIVHDWTYSDDVTWNQFAAAMRDLTQQDTVLITSHDADMELV